jgi:tetratricopeptide (TPR) repeat protein
MWEFLKKTAGAALEYGAAYLLHLNAIQQIMNAPDYDVAIQRLRDYVFRLESQEDFDHFLSVVAQQHQSAQTELQNAKQNPSGESWGNSVEDRIAQSMAEIQAGYHSGNSASVQQAEKQLHDLVLLRQYAEQFWAEAQSTHSMPPPQVPVPEQILENPPFEQEVRPAERKAAFEKHMQSILSMSSSDEAPAAMATGAGEPLEEMAALTLLLEADRRSMEGMMKSLPGIATPETISLLEECHDTYARILKDGPTDSSLLLPADLHKKMGQSLEFAGNASESLRDDQGALDYFRRALNEFDLAGDDNEQARMTGKISKLETLLSGDQDAEILALQESSSSGQDLTLEEVERLIALGAAYSKAGDMFAARDNLEAAETMLADMGVEEPPAQDLARDLMSSMQSIMDGSRGEEPTAVETSMKHRGLFKQLYQLLSAAYRDADPEDPNYEADLARADEYMSKWERMDSQAENKQFSSEALSLLQGQFSDLLKR